MLKHYIRCFDPISIRIILLNVIVTVLFQRGCFPRDLWTDMESSHELMDSNMRYRLKIYQAKIKWNKKKEFATKILL